MNDPTVMGSPSRGRIARLVLPVFMAAVAWGLIHGWRWSACQREGQEIEGVFTYDDRLELRNVTNAPDVPEGAPSWNDVRLSIEAYMRDWSELRADACMDIRVEVEHCLDSQKTQLSRMMDRWIAGDRSWASEDLDELLPSVSDCVEPSR